MAEEVKEDDSSISDIICKLLDNNKSLLDMLLAKHNNVESELGVCQQLYCVRLQANCRKKSDALKYGVRKGSVKKSTWNCIQKHPFYTRKDLLQGLQEHKIF